MPDFPIDPRSAAANQLSGITSPRLTEQMMSQGGLPFPLLTRMEFAAHQAGNTEQMQRVRDIMDRRRAAIQHQLLVPQPTMPVEEGGAQGLLNAANEMNRANPFMLFENRQFDEPVRGGEQGDFRIFR